MIEYNHQDDWFYEGQISKKLVAYFIKNGYTILKDNSDKISASGEDIIVSIQEQQEIIESLRQQIDSNNKHFDAMQAQLDQLTAQFKINKEN